MLRFKSALAAAILFISPVVPAQAAVVIAAFSGEILTGTTISLFTGSADAFDLSPLPDGTTTPIYGLVSYDTGLAPADGFGGYGGDGVTEWLNFQVTLLGQTYTFGAVDPADANFQFGTVAVDVLDLQYQRFGGGEAEAIGIRLDGYDFLAGTDLPDDFTYTSMPGGIGSLDIQTANGTASAFFTVNWASTRISAIPEPATWLNLIVGFGVVGGLVRRRSKVRTAIC